MGCTPIYYWSQVIAAMAPYYMFVLLSPLDGDISVEVVSGGGGGDGGVTIEKKILVQVYSE